MLRQKVLQMQLFSSNPAPSLMMYASLQLLLCKTISSVTLMHHALFLDTKVPSNARSVVSKALSCWNGESKKKQTA